MKDEASLPPVDPVPPFASGTTRSATLIREHDWTSHPLGPPGGWPDALKMALGALFDSAEAMFLLWYPGDYFVFFNDSAIPLLTDRAEAVIGRPFGLVWPELIERTAPLFASVLHGRAVRHDDMAWQRFGDGRTQSWYSFSHARLRDVEGVPVGIVVVAYETTARIRAVEASRAAEERNRQILDSAIDHAVIATDLDGRVTGWNEGARRLFGWTEEEMLGRSIERFFTDEDIAACKVSEEMGAVLMTGRASSDGWRLRADGGRFWASGRMTPLTSDTGDVVGFVKVVRDLTEERLAAEAIRDVEDRLRRAQEAGGVGLFTIAEDGMVQGTAYFFRLYGLGETDAVPASVFEKLVFPEDAALASDSVSRREGTTPLDVEYRIRRADTGEMRWIARRGTFEQDAEGRTIRFVGSVRDVTEQVVTREALRRLNATLEAAIEARTAERDRMWRLSRDLMVVVDFVGIIQAANPAWTEIFGWAHEELIGRNILDLVHPDDLVRSRGELGQLGKGERTIAFENRFRVGGGEYRWLSWTAVPDDRFIHAVGRDIQADKERESEFEGMQEALRQSQKMEAVGQLTGGIAHDFNNLLTGISGSLEILSARVAQGRFGELGRYTDAAQDAARRAAALTHRLLAFSRRQTLDPRPTDVNRLVAGMEDLVRRTMGPGVEVEVLMAAGLWPTLVDPNQLEGALLNLCINARDAMPGGGRLTVETRNRSIDARTGRERDMTPGDYVVLRVSDTGTGMSANVIAKAFDPFFTTKPLGLGTGLGLSMVYGFARQSGGQVRISSEEGAGATVGIYLPRHGVAAADAEVPVASLPSSPAAAGETVLVVDDEASIRMLAVEMLADLGYTTLEAMDGAGGLAILNSDARIDLLVTDVGLPGGMNGRQMVDAAKRHRPDLQVLFITGYAETAVIGNGQLEPGLHVMTKPFTIDAFAARVRSLLGRQEVRD